MKMAEQMNESWMLLYKVLANKNWICFTISLKTILNAQPTVCALMRHWKNCSINVVLKAI